MRRATPLAALALFLAAATGLAVPPQAAAAGPQDAGAAARGASARLSAEGRYIVLLRDGASVDEATTRAGRLGVKADRAFRSAVRGFAAKLDAAQLAALRADPSVDAVVPDEVISMTAQSIPTGVRRVNGRESLVAGIDGEDTRVDADVAIVDTGVGGKDSRQHEDLNIAGGYNCADATPDDGLPPSRSNWGDPNGHGTHVAGTVGALDNGIGVVGVAPGVRLWAVRILDSAGNGLVSWYVCGLDWITGQRDPLDPTRPRFEAVNMSVAKAGSDDGNCGLTNKDVIHQAICRLVASGVTVVAAAGNDGKNASTLRPASYNEVITVSALADTDGKRGGTGGTGCYSWGGYDRDDTFADFSNYGGDVDLIAPGKCILSTLPGNRYGTISGTSMAAPLVTGAAALYTSSRPLATPAEVRAALRAAGTQDWNTATDPDSVHEPLLDVSHIVAPDDWTLDATPGTSGGALVGAAGATLQAPVSIIRGEAFPGAISLAVAATAPLTATLGATVLAGAPAVGTGIEVVVPLDTPSGGYRVTVTATDGTRERTSTYPVTVDSVPPTAVAPAMSLRAGGTLAGGVNAVAAWVAASDPGGGVSRYEARWRVDGTLGAASSLSSSARQVSREVVQGHTYALRLRARDAAGNWSPWVESEPFAPVLSQDTSPTLARSGRWIRYERSWMSGGSSLYSKARGATVTRSFTGRAIAFVTSKGPTRGKAKLYVDGTLAASLDLRRSSAQHRVVVFSRSWAAAGPHMLKVVVLGTSGRPRVDVDAFVIVP